MTFFMKYFSKLAEKHPMTLRLVGFLFLVMIVVVSRLDMFLGFISAPFLQGWDGASHQAVTEYYSAHIFPSLWGWIPNWYAGMPFPQFYPPLFYFIVALVGHILPFLSLLTITKCVVLILLFLLPYTLFKLAKRLTDSHLICWSTALLCTLFMSSTWFSFGLSTISTIGTAMISQLLGFVLLVLWLFIFLNDRPGKYKNILSILCLTGVFFSNAHIVFFSIFMGLFMAIAEILYPSENTRVINKIWTAFKKYALLYIVGAGLAACWYFPLIAHYEYFSGISIPEAGAAIEYLLRYWYLIILGVLSLPASLDQKNRPMFLLSLPLYCFTLLIILFAFADTIHFTFPIHVARWLAPHLFLSTILIPYGFFWVSKNIKNKYRFYIVGVLAVIVLGLYVPELKSPYTYPFIGGYYLSYDSEDIPSLVANFPKDGKLATVEVNLRHSQPMSFVIDAALGTGGAMTTFSNLRESSISSLFLGPFRNTLSNTWELWGSPSLLGKRTNFYETHDQKNLNRARFLGVQNFLAISLEMYTDFTTMKELQNIKNLGDFSIFTFKKSIPQAQVLKYQPIAMFAPVHFREHGFNDLDYIRLQEEYFEDGKNMDTVVALASDQMIDTSRDINMFSYLLIVKPLYQNVDVAAARLLAFAAADNHKILVMNTPDPLVEILLRKINHDPSVKNIYFFDPTITADEPFKEVITFIRSHHINSNAVNEEAKLIATKNHMNIELPISYQSPQPVTIKRSYFPEWLRTNQKDTVYLVSPTYMLTFATSSFALEFKTPKSVWLGWIVSAVVFLYIMIWTLIIRRKDKINK